MHILVGWRFRSTCSRVGGGKQSSVPLGVQRGECSIEEEELSSWYKFLRIPLGQNWSSSRRWQYSPHRCLGPGGKREEGRGGEKGRGEGRGGKRRKGGERRRGKKKREDERGEDKTEEEREEEGEEREGERSEGKWVKGGQQDVNKDSLIPRNTVLRTRPIGQEIRLPSTNR